MQRAEAVLARQPASLPPLAAAAEGFRAWTGGRNSAGDALSAGALLAQAPLPQAARAVDRGGGAPVRAILGARPVLPVFFGAIEHEAADGLDLLTTMERAWFDARRGIAGRRKELP